MEPVENEIFFQTLPKLLDQHNAVWIVSSDDRATIDKSQSKIHQVPFVEPVFEAQRNPVTTVADVVIPSHARPLRSMLSKSHKFALAKELEYFIPALSTYRLHVYIDSCSIRWVSLGGDPP
jgi:hypothetical protein